LTIMSDLDDTKGVSIDSNSPPSITYGLTVEADDEGTERERDIVALHGITGAEKDTWALSKEPDKCWLPEAFPKSRIILYRYSTDCLNETWFTEAGIVAESLNLLKSLADLRDREPREQQKPLIFVSHDVGGAIVKSALIHAARNPNQYEHIFSSVRALIFFGYPHSPVNVTALQEKLAVAIMMDNEKPARWGTITPLTTSLARALVGINHRFCQTKLWLRAHFVNVYSDRPSKVRHPAVARTSEY
jgi:hypothetical protein